MKYAKILWRHLFTWSIISLLFETLLLSIKRRRSCIQLKNALISHILIFTSVSILWFWYNYSAINCIQMLFENISKETKTQWIFNGLFFCFLNIKWKGFKSHTFYFLNSWSWEFSKSCECDNGTTCMSYIVSTIPLEAITRLKKPCGINYIEVMLKT